MRHVLARCSVVIAAWILYVAPICAADEAKQPDADALVKAVEESEQWIHKVRSFYAKIESVWTRTPEAIARGKAERKKQFPDADLSTKRWPEFLPERREELILAFDGKRLYKRVFGETASDRTQFWDGTRSVSHEKYFSHDQEGYGIAPTPEHLGQNFFMEWSWLRAGQHSFWWYAPPESRGYRFDQEGAQRWKVAGREMYRGIDCWIIQKEYGWTKWYIGVEQPLLHGMITYVSNSQKKTENKIALEMAKRFGAPAEVDSAKAFYNWKKSLPKDRQAEVQEAHVRAKLEHAYPLAEHMLLDYKEVRPGWWFPMSQGYDLHDDASGQANPIVSISRRFKVLELKLDEPLPDELFKMEFNEGVEVYDRTHNPPLSYKHKAKFTDAEWKAIVDEANKNKQFWEEQKAAHNALIGKPAPAFPPDSEWINSAPLTWEKLKGKPVIIDFFADWCAPCRNDLPTMAALHEDAADLSFNVMGVHPPGSDRKSVDKLIKEFELKYPICIDMPARGSWGELFAAYNVKSIPHAVLVDAEGNIAAHGSLGEMIAHARKMKRGD